MSIKKRNSVTSTKKYTTKGGFPSFKKSSAPKPAQTTSYNTVSVIPGTTQVDPVIPVAQLQQPSSSLPYNTVSVIPGTPPVEPDEQNIENEANKKKGIFAFITKFATILHTIYKSGYDFIVNIINKTNEIFININLSQIKDLNLKNFIRNKLTELNKLLDDPVVQQNLNELAIKGGIYGNVAISMAFSNVEKLENEMINIVIRGADKITSALVNIALNAASAIPLLGTAIGAARAFDNAMKMIETIITTNLEIIEKVSDFNKNFINSFTEKIKSMDNLNNGKNNFNQQNSNFMNNLQKNNIKLKGGAVSAIKRANEIKKRVNKSIAHFHRTNKVKTRRRHS